MQAALRRALWAVLIALLFVPVIAVGNVAPPDPRQELKKEFAAFFAQVDDKSLAAFGAVKNSPETLKAIETQIDRMSDEQVARLRETVGAFPTPAAITEAFPPAAREAIKKRTAEFANVAPRAEQTRDDVLALTQMLKQLPDAKLRELGIDRARVEAVETAFTKMSLMDAAAIQTQLSGNAEWQTQSAKAVGTLPPAVRRGAIALAKHGPITPEEAKSLETFRGELTTLLRRIDALPADMQKELNAENLEAKIVGLGTATPDALFMMRHELTPEKVRLLDGTLNALERAARLTPEEVEDLNSFRSELVSSYASLQPDTAGEAKSKLASLDAKDLMLLREQLGTSPDMVVAGPAIYRTLSAPGFADRIAALQQPTPDPAAVRDLEQFRADALRYIDASAQGEPELAARARQVMQDAPLARLEFLRGVNGNLPEQASAHTRMAVVAEGGCGIWIAGVWIPLDFLCTAIDAITNTLKPVIDTVKTALTAAINIAVDTIKAALNDVIKLVTDPVGFIKEVVSNIAGMATDIWNALSALAVQAAAEVTKAFQALLNIPIPGTTFTLQDVLNAAEGKNIKVPMAMVWNFDGSSNWDEYVNQPVWALDCPAANTPTSFGLVGSRDAAQQAERTRYFLDTLVDLVPSTEISFLAKSQMMGSVTVFAQLTTCLKQAWEDAAAAEQTARHAAIIANSNANSGLLANQLLASYNSLTGLLGDDTNAVKNAITSASNTIQTAINDLADEGKDLDLRLQVELNLTSKQPLAMFQLPHANGGYLELARDIVSQTISAMLAAGQSVGKASTYYEQGLAAMNLGKFKDAYLSFQNAYLELTAR